MYSCIKHWVQLVLPIYHECRVIHWSIANLPLTNPQLKDVPLPSNHQLSTVLPLGMEPLELLIFHAKIFGWLDQVEIHDNSGLFMVQFWPTWYHGPNSIMVFKLLMAVTNHSLDWFWDRYTGKNSSLDYKHGQMSWLEKVEGECSMLCW